VHAQTIKIAVAWASRVPNQHVQHAATVRRCARSAHYCNDIIADNLLLITNTSDHALVVIYHTAFDHHQLMMLAVVPMYEHLCEGIGMFERLWWWLHQAVAVASGKCVWVCCLCTYSIQSSVGSLLAHTIALLFVSRVLQGRHVARCLPTPANHKFQSRTITPPVCCNLFLGGMTLVHHIGRACFVGSVSLPLALPTNQSSHRNLNANAKPKLHWNTPTPCLSPKLICNVLSC
jgi:hypothetical protein